MQRWLLGVFASASNAADLDLSNDEKINGGGDISDYDTENSMNQRDNSKEELDPLDSKTFFYILLMMR